MFFAVQVDVRSGYIRLIAAAAPGNCVENSFCGKIVANPDMSRSGSQETWSFMCGQGCR